MVLTKIVLGGLVLSSAHGYNSDSQNVAKAIEHTLDQPRRRLDDGWEAVGRACQPEAGSADPLPVRNAASLEACQALCAEEPTCRAVEFDKDNECLLHASVDLAKTAAEGPCTEYNCCYVHTNKCDTMELSNFILNTKTCDELKDVPMDCMFDDKWTAKEAMAYNAVYCEVKFDSHADYITYLKECAVDDSKCDSGKDSPDDSDSSTPEPPCNKQQLKMMIGFITPVETCDQLFTMLFQRMVSEDFPKCDPGTNVEIGDPSNCTNETVALIKKRLQENVAKATETTGQLGSPDDSDSSSPDPPCNKKQLKLLFGLMMHYQIETCDQLYEMLAHQRESKDFPKCDPGINIELGNPSECTDETVALIKKRLQENIAKAKDTRGQLGSSLSDSEEPSAATRHTYGGALFASLVMSAALAIMLL